MKKILIPIDGSEGSMKASSLGMDLAGLHKADVTLLYVSDTSKYLIANFEAYNIENINKRGEKILEEAKNRFKDLDVKIDTQLKIGDTASEIIDLAEKEDFDLVVMGSRGLGAFSRTFLGSVSNKVVHHIKKSVLIAK